MANKFLAALFAAILPTIAAPIAASAQEDAPPAYADAAPGPAAQDQQIRGRIASFDGQYNLQVRDENGYVDNVNLHPGTIINPTGLTLQPGMVVSILGYNAGSYFSANEIDTPYSIDAGVPYYEGHPWSYFGAGISLGFFFGNVGWWQPHYVAFFGHPYYGGFYGGGFYGRPYGAAYYGHPYGGYYNGGVHVNVGVNVNSGYRYPEGYHGAPAGGYYHGTAGYAPQAGRSYAPGGSYHGSSGGASYRTTQSYRSSGGGPHGGGGYHH